MYTMNTRVRFSEVDEYKRLRLHELINYFQNCSIFHSEDAGIGFDYLDTVHRVWIMCYWQIHILRLPCFGEEVTVSTVPYDFKSSLGRRNFILKTASGELLAYADSVWTYEDTATMLPTKILPENIAAYGVGEPYPMEHLSRKLPLPDEMTAFAPFPVQQTQLDTNHHVNNGQYVYMALPYLPTGSTVSTLRIEYKRPAKLGDLIYPYSATENDTCYVLLANEQKQPYAILHLTVNNTSANDRTETT